MHDELRVPLSAIGQEVLTNTGLQLEVRDEDWNALPGSSSAWLISKTGSRTGIFVTDQDDDQRRTVDLAAQVQDFVHEELSATGRPAAWPSCPTHPDRHPLSPVLVGAHACWRCPVSQEVIREIGRKP